MAINGDTLLKCVEASVVDQHIDAFVSRSDFEAERSNGIEATEVRIVNFNTRAGGSVVNARASRSSLCLVTCRENQVGTTSCQLDGSKLTNSAGGACKDNGGIAVRQGLSLLFKLFSGLISTIILNGYLSINERLVEKFR